MKQKKYLSIGTLCLTAALYGCGQNLDQIATALSSNDFNDPETAIQKPFETLGTTDEAMGFSDSDVIGTDEDFAPYVKGKASLAATADVAVAVIADPPPPIIIDDVPKEPDCPRLETYFLKLRWGQIFRDHRELDQEARDQVDMRWMNWSGSLSAKSGHLSLIKPILFEKNGEAAPPDMIHHQTDRNVIAFDSYTKPHYDGLLVKYQHCMSDVVVDPPVVLLPTEEMMAMSPTETNVLPVPTDILPMPKDAVITFSARGLLPEPFVKGWTLRELHKIDHLYRNVNANHDTFHIQALRLRDHCDYASGTIHGIWSKANERFGHIKGRVVSSAGDPMGHLKGFYAVKTNDEGFHKLVAKFIGDDGKFLGMMVGTAKDGHFSADILSRDRVKIGALKGRYSEGDARRKGTFSAIYEVKCPIVVPAPTPIPEPVPVPVPPVVGIVPVEPITPVEIPQ